MVILLNKFVLIKKNLHLLFNHVSDNFQSIHLLNHFYLLNQLFYLYQQNLLKVLSYIQIYSIKLLYKIKSLNLKIECAGEIFDISHSLLKLAWTTRDL